MLGSVSAQEHRKLAPAFETVQLRRKETIWAPGRRIPFVYFPENAMISVVSTMQDGSSVEVGVIGREGMAGLPVMLNGQTSPAEGFVQIPGEATRMASADFLQRVPPGSALHRILLRYTGAFLVQAAQSAACNRLHNLKQRCARWLLMTQDQVGEAEFPLTQEFLSQMLGVRRAGVTEAASGLHDMGLISYTRGRVKISDEEGLRKVSCECYSVVREEYDKIFPSSRGTRKRD